YMNYQTFSVELAPGDRVFFYTDGIPETRNREGREIGLDDGLLNMFERARRGSLKEMMEAIFEEMDRYRGDRPVEDDLLLIGIEIMKQARGR
ncbi:MAG TPA: SpoIIE family protein phosphatase, partial [Spirochaetota bacterium]|nr:SpoIIE family protein phosphatase [Spirochaetota bacterium]